LAVLRASGAAIEVWLPLLSYPNVVVTAAVPAALTSWYSSLSAC
jgi:hypothetical protein